jgi:anaerobic nitric oxide reductase transcription regulator
MNVTAQQLLELATDLTAKLGEADRYERLLAAVRSLIDCDATALLRYDGKLLELVASQGLVPELQGRRFRPADHPRLAAILAASEREAEDRLVRFPANTDLPDPWDGFMLGDPHACARVHACMGCPLLVGEQCIGLLTIDALDPQAFDGVDRRLLGLFAAVAAATVHSATLIEALEHRSTRQEQQLQLINRSRQQGASRMLGVSPAMQRLRAEIDLVAASDLSVLITGETGVGKELVANAIHAGSARADDPMITVNCAALPDQLVESQLFGHVRGAFTGAERDRPGVFEVADGGTVFLDEVGELPLTAQATLLRALQQGEIQRVGSDRPLRVNVRVIAATNRDLEAEQAAGRFRSDLFYRLSVFPVAVPPLRQRREDISVLIGHILERERHRLGSTSLRLDAEARAALLAYDWPGNVRELEHVLMRAAIRAIGENTSGGGAAVLRTRNLNLDALPSPSAQLLEPQVERSVATLREQQDHFTRRVLAATLERTTGNWSAAARQLGSTASNLQRLARRLGVQDDAAPG